MKGHPERCQWFESSLNVDFGAARDTNVEIWEAEVNENRYKIENLFSRSWHPGIIGTLIESVYDKVYRASIRK